MELKFVIFDKLFLEESWTWLNDPEIRNMTCTPVFSKEQQYQWFEALEQRHDYMIHGICCDGIRIGVFGIKNIVEKKGEYWGYIGNKEYWGKGLGMLIINEAIMEANKLQLKKLYLKVLKTNTRAVSLYKKMNFIITGQSSNCYFMELFIHD